MTIDVGQDAGDSQGERATRVCRARRVAERASSGAWREKRPQFGQFAFQLSAAQVKRRAGNGRQQVGFAGGQRAQQRAVRRQCGRILL